MNPIEKLEGLAQLQKQADNAHADWARPHAAPESGRVWSTAQKKFEAEAVNHDYAALAAYVRRLAQEKDEAVKPLACGHPSSLLIKSVESEYVCCELCEMKDRLRDALADRLDLKAKLETEQEITEAAFSSGKSLAAYCADEAAFVFPMRGHDITARDCIRSLRQRLATVEAERDRYKSISAEHRKAGRAEAVAILMTQDAETWPGDSGYKSDDACIRSHPIGDTGDYSTNWDRDRLLTLFDASDSVTASWLDELEGRNIELYYDKVAAEDDLATLRQRLAEQQAVIDELNDAVVLYNDDREPLRLEDVTYADKPTAVEFPTEDGAIWWGSVELATALTDYRLAQAARQKEGEGR